MLAQLKTFYNKIEGLKGRKLVVVLLVILAVFLPIGIIIGYFTKPTLTKDELKNPVVTEQSAKVYKTGKITFVNPNTYPDDKIGFSLIDAEGNETLLQAKDQKLAIAEGLVVKVGGHMIKSKNGQFNILVAEEILINAAN